MLGYCQRFRDSGNVPVPLLEGEYQNLRLLNLHFTTLSSHFFGTYILSPFYYKNGTIGRIGSTKLGQMISKAIFLGLNSSKKQSKRLKIFALATRAEVLGTFFENKKKNILR